MSSYHGLETSEKGHQSDVVFHIVVPDENNGVGVNLRTALAQKLARERELAGITIISVVPWLPTGAGSESEQIENGEVYEHQEAVRYSANLSLVEKRTVIDNRYTALASVIPDRIRERLRFWGLDRDVP